MKEETGVQSYVNEKDSAAQNSEDGGGAMSQGSFEEMEKPENRFFPLGLRKECMPAENLILSH